jgi:hypothetical protein
LAKRYAPSRTTLYSFIKRSPRNPVITRQCDQLLDVRVRVVPKLDGIRKIERPPNSHYGIVNETGTSSTDSPRWFRMPALELSLTHLPQDTGIDVELPRFHVFDGSSRIVIEAHDQEDALCVCIEMGWDLICACDG